MGQHVAKRKNVGNAGKGVSVSASVGVISLISGIILLPLVISAIGAAAYGIWLFLLGIANFLFYLDFGMGTATVHFLSRSRSGDTRLKPDRISSTAQAWAVGATGIAIVIFILVSLWFLSTPNVRSVATEVDSRLVLVAGLVLLGGMMLRPMSSVLTGSGYLHIERQYQVAGVFVRVIGTLFACFYFRTLGSIALVETAALITPTICSFFKVRKMRLVQLKIRYVSSNDLKLMMKYSLGAFSVSVLGSAVLQSGSVMIGILGAPSQVTYFNAAFRVYSSVRQVIGWITDPFRPVLSRLFVYQQKRARTVLYDLLFVTFALSCIGCIFIIILSMDFIQLWLGSEVPWMDISYCVWFLLFGLLLNSIHIPLVPASDAAGFPGAFWLHQFLWLIFIVVMSTILFSYMGIVGVAIAMTAPLPILEYAYLLRSRRTVQLEFKKWFSRVLQPCLPILLNGVVVFIIVQLGKYERLGAAIGALVFVLLSLIILFYTKNKWSYKSILETFRVES